MESWLPRMTQKKAEFIAKTRDRLTEMEGLLATLTYRPADATIIKQLAGHFHQLAGGGGIYELDDLCMYAQFGETIVFALVRQGGSASPDAIDKLKEAVESMRGAIEVGRPDARPQEDTGPLPAVAPQISVTSTAKDKGHLRIFVVSSDPEHTEALEPLLAGNDFEFRVFGTSAEALDALKMTFPDGLLVDIPLVDGNGYELVANLRNLPGGNKPPVVMLSREQGFLDKVGAIRAGVDAFFEHPLDFQSIVDKLRYLLDRDKPERFRILSVEDDPDQAEFIRATLEFAGYNVLTLNDPKAFEEALLAFCPDLLLLDVMMGDITGFEIAKYVRQMERFVALPILFLTTQNQLEAHIESARSGGDDHLIKPIAPPLLVATVAGRLERYRVFQKMLKREGLTQCLTHSAFIERAGALVEPFQRRFSLVLMLIDIDGLRYVNERYGFPAGDKVILTVSNLLKKTFRHSELIGRIGGDSFGVMVENLSVPEVAELGQTFLRELAAVEHVGGGEPFFVTASSGVAALGDGMDLKVLISDAEQALQSAKAQGRNRLVRAAGKALR
jgi:diguanylate cyclase (GGDEF)-like protein